MASFRCRALTLLIRRNRLIVDNVLHLILGFKLLVEDLFDDVEEAFFHSVLKEILEYFLRIVDELFGVISIVRYGLLVTDSACE